MMDRQALWELESTPGVYARTCDCDNGTQLTFLPGNIDALDQPEQQVRCEVCGGVGVRLDWEAPEWT